MENLVPYLMTEGYECLLTSSKRNRYIRLGDILATILTKRREIETLCLQVYSGPSFVVEDLASALGKLLGHRILMVLHGGDIPNFVNKHPRWVTRVLGRANTLVVPSSYLAHPLESYGFHPEIIPNSLDVSSYPYRLRSSIGPRLLWMRAFHPVYNPTLAVSVLENLKNEFPDATLTMAGQDKGSLKAVRELATRAGLADSVNLPGFLDGPAKHRALQGHDIFINTSRTDNMPITLLEAAASGLPVVTSRAGGISAIFTHEREALLVSEEDAVQFARAISRLIREPDLTRFLSSQGRELSETFDVQQILPRWEKLFSAAQGSG